MTRRLRRGVSQIHIHNSEGVAQGIMNKCCGMKKRGHQLVPLKCFKGAPTHSSFMLCQQNGACMQNGTNNMLISNFD